MTHTALDTFLNKLAEHPEKLDEFLSLQDSEIADWLKTNDMGDQEELIKSAMKKLDDEELDRVSGGLSGFASLRKAVCDLGPIRPLR